MQKAVSKTDDPNYKNLFVIRDNDKILLYFPLKQSILLVNESLLDILRSGKTPKEIVKISKKKDINLWSLEKNVNPKGSMPTDLVILPTYNCNLRCVYCYSYGGDKKTDLPWEIAKAAIDFKLKHDKKKDHKYFKISFLGGGEPTLNWEVFKNTIKYCKTETRSINRHLYSTVSTNGMLSKDRAEWISKNISGVQISFDGLKDIQNYSRPTGTGVASYKTVFRNSKIIDKNRPKNKNTGGSRLRLSFRSTIINKFVDKLPEVTEFFIDNFENTTEICFEPVHKTGRYGEGKCTMPKQEDFVKYFIEARKIGRKNKIPVIYGSANLKKLSLRYCSTPGRMFVLTPDGTVTSCNEVSYPEDKLSDIFIYGKYNHATKSFDIDMKKLDKLRTITIDNKRACEGCFAKFHCCGGCPVVSAKTSGSALLPFYDFCKMVRGILKEELFHIAEHKKEPVQTLSTEMVEC